VDHLQTLKKSFGFSSFRPGQEEIVNLVLARENLLAVLPTGAGKSLCYQLPALCFKDRTVVVSPLIALMNDQTAYLKSLNIPADQIHSHSRKNQKVWEAFQNGEIKILYLSPERLMTEQMISQLKRLPIDLFVIDEAHCISKWGAGFRPEYEQLSQLKDHFPSTVLVAFTATADNATRLDIVKKLMGGKAQTIVKGFDRPNLSLSVFSKQNWKKKLLDFLNERKGCSGIIYTLSRKDTEKVSDFLTSKGFYAIPYHAGQSAKQRQDSQNTFMTESGVIMLATIAFGMGIDKPDIRFVVHINLPSSMEAFYQEIGRAGRDGEPSDTLLFFGLDDLMIRKRMIQEGEEAPEYKLKENKRLDALVAYCEASSCRKKALLSYFDEIFDRCGNCDNCLNPPKLIEGTTPAQILLSAIARTGEYFGSAHIIDIVRGISTEKVQERRHDQIPTFGKGSHYSKPFWQNFTRQMISAGEIVLNIERYGALKITDSGRSLLYGKKSFYYKELSVKAKAIQISSQIEKGFSKKRKSSQTSQNLELLKKLKKLRLEIAHKENVPAFVIFSDRTLIEMSNKPSQNKEQLLEINGVGPKKLELYGELFLKLMKEPLIL